MPASQAPSLDVRAAAAAQAAAQTLSPPQRAPVQRTLRDVYQRVITKFFPGFTPQDNFELVVLGSATGAEGTLDALKAQPTKREIRAWLDEQWEMYYGKGESREDILSEMEELLRTRVADISTGVRLNKISQVIIRADIVCNLHRRSRPRTGL